MTDTAVTVQKSPLVVLRDRLEARSAEIKAALPGIPPERFIRAVITAASINPDILACQFNSVWLACMRACRDGLLPDGVEGAIVPYKDKATWIPMYRGLLRKFQESGQFRWISADVVRAGELFEFWITQDGPHFKHVPGDDGEAAVEKVYAIATTQSGGTFVAVLSMADIAKIRAMSRASRSDAPWILWTAEMQKKSALRRLSKMLPTASPILDDEEADDVDYQETPKLAAVPRARGAAAALDAFSSSPVDDTGETGGGGGEPTDRSPHEQSPQSTTATDVEADPKIAIARERGREAKAKGYTRQALPSEYRDPSRDAEAQAWVSGLSDKPG